MQPDSLHHLTHQAALSLVPPPRMTVSQWATAHRQLRSDYAKEPGNWRPERTPYLVEPMDRLSIQDPCRELVMITAAQVGKTTIGENWLGYIADVAPGPSMFVQPTDDDCADWVDSRIQPMIDDCPRLTDSFDKPNEQGAVATKLKKGFRGGTVYFKGTNSSSKSRSKSIRFLCMDETDAFKAVVGKDGNPIKLFEARTTTYGDQAKIYKSSTPTDEDGRIWQEFLDSDQHVPFVTMPCCGGKEWLRWRGILAPHKNQLGKVVYQCPNCGALIEEHRKGEFLTMESIDWTPWIQDEARRRIVLDLLEDDLGRELSDADLSYDLLQHPIWRLHAAPNEGRKVGYWLNGLHSPYGWLSWQTIWDEHESAQGDPTDLQVWTNTRMAEPWMGLEGDRVDKHELSRLCEPYATACPDGVKIITAGVDVQDDRIELLVAGWGDRAEPWHLDHHIIYGDPEGQDVWQALDEHLRATYDQRRIVATCVDSGGHHTDRVYLYCRSRKAARVWAVKGSSNLNDPIWPIRATRIKRLAVNLFMVGVHKAKYGIFQRLQYGPDQRGRFHFPSDWPPDYRDEYFAQLAAEALVPYKKLGQTIHRFEKIRERNEILDLWVYAYAALTGLRHMGLDLDRLGESAPAPRPTIARKPKRDKPGGLPKRKKWIS